MSDHPAPDIPRTLVVTADFPPTVGGVQQYVHSLVHRFPENRVTVLTSTHEGWEASDATQPFRVRRVPTKWLWPGRGLTERIEEVVRDTGAEAVLFASGYPAAISGPALAKRGVPYIVATHGIEHWIALVPGGPALMRSAFGRASRVVAISRFTARAIGRGVPGDVPLEICHPGVDVDKFRPDVDGGPIRLRHKVFDRPLVVCVSRFVKRKGQDVLVRGMERIVRRVPDAVLLMAGTGPDHDRVVRLAREAPDRSVVFAGVIPEEELPMYHAAADVFAMPCRSRAFGLEAEGFGMVFTEASASGKPVVAGRSGGAAEAVVDGETGLVVDGRQTEAVAEAVSGLLLDPFRAEHLGKAGRVRAERELAWTGIAGRYAGWLREAAG
ncbi:MAG: glycosyltransferase family 4 protein [Actinomycetota bacterium]